MCKHIGNKALSESDYIKNYSHICFIKNFTKAKIISRIRQKGLLLAKKVSSINQTQKA